MSKLYIPEGVWLACNKGTSPSTLRVSNHKRTTIYSQPMATEADKLPFFNIKPMGLCSVNFYTVCFPFVTTWDDTKEGVKINGNRMLLENSTCQCSIGGKITIHFDRDSAVSYGLGEGKKPTDYIKDYFDSMAEQSEKDRANRDSWLPDQITPLAHINDWFNDLESGLVEGTVNGVVGLGELIYDVGQDPVGIGEGLWNMAKDTGGAIKDSVKGAWNWAKDGDNWSNAAEGSWNWASDGDNWKNAASNAWEGTKNAAGWVANNPRKIGTTVGEFIPDAVAAAYTMGGSLATTTGKVALKEGGETLVEKTIKEEVKDIGEKTAKEFGEAAANKTFRETLETLGKNEADDIAKVVTKEADEIIEAGGKKGGWNKALNGELKPNSIYDVDGYKYHTDDLGRVTKVEGDLTLSPRGRNNYQQGKSVDIKDGIEGDQGGHLIGNRFNGPGEQINYVPQKESLNNGVYKSMENEWARALKKGKSVKVKIENIYDGSSKRPIGQQVDYWINGVKESKTFVN